jgi:hypothetical protein
MSTRPPLQFARWPELATAPLSALCRTLTAEQRSTWPVCAEGHRALAAAQRRQVRCIGFDVQLQLNQRRIVSTAADVHAAAVQARACFLCPDRLPPEQRGIFYRDELWILCNPAPIFPDHFTVSHREHRPQSILPFVDALVRLAEDVAPELSVFYNGPRCGASAPDHFHFQMVTRGAIPVEGESQEQGRKRLLREVAQGAVFTIEHYGRTVAVLESPAPAEAVALLRRFISAWQAVSGNAEEPLLNLLCLVHGGGVRTLVMLRQKHRPDAYFRKGDAKVTISPATVDMGGLIITPVALDFERTDARLVEEIFAEVSTPAALLTRIVEAL